MSEGKLTQTAPREYRVALKGPAVLYQFEREPGSTSRWSLSWGKRVFDVLSVLLILPLLLPVLLVIALSVRLTSFGPILFKQTRIGRDGRPFTILKFRTMEHIRRGSHRTVTTAGNQRFTPIGPFLRRWKLDELPQLLNVIKGDMSLVGPRPKLPQHQVARLRWRPGITGAATFAFAREEEFLAFVPAHQLDLYYHGTVLPAKHKLDSDYMCQSTARSDIKLIVDTLLRRWGKSPLEDLLKEFEQASQSGKFSWSVEAHPAHHVLQFEPTESVASGD